MSVVTNVVLTWGCGGPDDYDEIILAAVNAFFQDPGSGFRLCEDYGGTKHLECGMAVGAFNFLNLPGLIAHLATHVPWDEPSEAQLWVKEQEDDRFTERPIR